MSDMLQMMKARLNERKKTFEADNTIFPFWNMAFGEVSTIRLVPYQDALSGGFWAEKKMIPMKFVDPSDPSKTIQYKAPCLEMYGRDQKCPVLKHVRELYSEAKSAQQSGDTDAATALKSIANAHWLSNTFYYQGFVRKTTIKEEGIPENPLRILPFTKKIHGWVMTTVFENKEDPFERLPTGEFLVEDIQRLLAGEVTGADLEKLNTKLEGRNVLLKKGKNGEWADWTTATSWHSQWTPLTDEEKEAIAKYGFHDLSKRLPERPSADQYAVLEEMVKESIGRMMGETDGFWNPEWEEAGFKPFRARGESDSTEEKTVRKPLKPVDTSADNAEDTVDEATPANSIMEKISASRGAKVEDEASAEPVAEKVEAKAETKVATPTDAKSKAASILSRVKAREAAKAAA